MISLFNNQIQLDLADFKKLEMYHPERLENQAMAMMKEENTPITREQILTGKEKKSTIGLLAILNNDLEFGG